MTHQHSPQEMAREAALQTAADANGGYIGPKIKQIVNAALNTVFAALASPPSSDALRVAASEILIAVAEGINWTDEKRQAYENLDAALQPSTDTAFSISKRRYEEKTASRSQPATGRG